jgi:hypothetical protein
MKAEMHMDGTKENAKGGIVSMLRTAYTFIEKKPKDAVGVPIKVRVIVEGNRLFKPCKGEIWKLEVSKEQKKLTDPQPSAKADYPPNARCKTCHRPHSEHKVGDGVHEFEPATRPRGRPKSK